MIDRITTGLFGRREGWIVVIASAVYLAIGVIAMIAPSVVRISEFYAWFCRFMPIPLLLVYAKMGGFRKNYESDAINTILIVVTALVPILVSLKTVFIR